MNPAALLNSGIFPDMLQELKRRGYWAIRETDEKGEVLKIVRPDGSGGMMVYRHKADDPRLWDRWAEMTLNVIGSGQ